MGDNNIQKRSTRSQTAGWRVIDNFSGGGNIEQVSRAERDWCRSHDVCYHHVGIASSITADGV